MPRRARTTRNLEALPPGSVRRAGKDLPTAQSRRQGAFERARTQERWRRRLKIAGISAGALVLLVAVALGVTYLQLRAGLSSGLAADPRIREVLDPTGGLSREPFYLLILGSDRREGEEVARSDTIILARIDMRENTVSMLSIPRDTRVNIPGHGMNKINAASALGGTSLMIETVREFTDLPVNHYLGIDFRGFKEIVDALGGVWIDVPMHIDDRQAASEFPEARVIEAGRQKLDGKHALTFVRARYSLPRQDLDRIENQQLFIRALVEQATGERNPLRLKVLGDATGGSIDTDLDVGQLIAVGRKLSGSLDMLDMAVVPVEPQRIEGVSYVVADDAELAVLIERMRQGQPMLPEEEESEPTVDRSSVSVTIHNGSGLAGVAGAAAARLEARDYAVGEVGNANQFVYDETLVVYQEGGAEIAALLVSDLGKGRAVAARGMYSFQTDILVVVGKDWGDH
jgi:polyisoprenyl-teichoic acid--peptidoglycan teichoic acid transferase